MESTLQRPAAAAPKAAAIAYWTVTALFCLQMGFTACFRMDLSWARLPGVALPREAWGFAAGTAVLWTLSYFLWRRR
jgi:hypothetical protein